MTINKILHKTFTWTIFIPIWENSLWIGFGYSIETLLNKISYTIMVETIAYIQTVLDHINNGFFLLRSQNLNHKSIKVGLDVDYGLNNDSVADLIQESLNAVSKAHPKGVLPDWDENCPTKSFVQNFVDRHGLVCRRTMGLSSPRGVPTMEMVMKFWTL